MHLNVITKNKAQVSDKTFKKNAIFLEVLLHQ